MENNNTQNKNNTQEIKHNKFTDLKPQKEENKRGKQIDLLDMIAEVEEENKNKTK